MDKKIAAEKIRALLEARVARMIGCAAADLPTLKIGSMAHFLFLLIGDSEAMPGFNTTMTMLRDLIGFEEMWSLEKSEPEMEEVPKAVMN